MSPITTESSLLMLKTLFTTVISFRNNSKRSYDRPVPSSAGLTFTLAMLRAIALMRICTCYVMSCRRG